MVKETYFLPENFIIWLLFILFCAVFYKNFFHLKIWARFLPLLIAIVLLNLHIKIQKNLVNDKHSLYIDMSYSNIFTDFSFKKKLIEDLKKEFNITDDNIFDFKKQKLNAQIWNFEKSYLENLSFEYLHPPEKNGIFITDVSLPIENNKEFTIKLPFTKNIEGIFDSKIPPACVLGDTCSLKFLIQSKQQAVLELITFNDKVLKINIKANFSGWVNFDIPIPSNISPQNIIFKANLISSNSFENKYKSITGLLSLQKGVPLGYFYSKNLNILTWRLSHVLEKNIFWNINSDTNLRTLKSKNFDFLIFLNEFNNFKTEKPTLTIMTNQRPDKLENNKTLIFENFYKNENHYTFFWHIPPIQNEIFIPVLELEKAIQIFAKSLKAVSPFFSGGLAEIQKPLYLQKKIENNLNLYFNSFVILKEFDPLSNRDFFMLPFYGTYSFNKFSFESEMQQEERISVYNASHEAENINSVSDIISNLKKILYDKKEKKVIPEFVDTIYSFGFLQPESKNNTFAEYIFIISFILFICAYWYLPVLKK
ncbi:MAG: hypothetical protein OEZ22_07630 [Spirochaetia bacterium]|nr:hypothetical protein [Spirochaetia bacterium]